MSSSLRAVSDLFGRTWLPTLLFVLAAFLFERAEGPFTPVPPGVVTLYVLVVTPIAWGVLTAGVRSLSMARGIVAGAVCGAVLIGIPATYFVLAAVVNPGDGEGQLVTIYGFSLLAIACVAWVAAGAGAGALTVFLRRQLPLQSHHPPPG